MAQEQKQEQQQQSNVLNIIRKAKSPIPLSAIEWYFNFAVKIGLDVNIVINDEMKIATHIQQQENGFPHPLVFNGNHFPRTSSSPNAIQVYQNNNIFLFFNWFNLKKEEKND